MDAELTNFPHQEQQPIDRTYRGYVSNRAFAPELPIPSDDICKSKLEQYEIKEYASLTVLEALGLRLADITPPILDVGPGGGRALEQALLAGLDAYAVELNSVTSTTVRGFMPSRLGLRQNISRENFKRLLNTYPGRIKVADAAVQVPFPDRMFNTVIASYSLPLYARNPQEAITSISEMVRVCKGLIAFTSKKQIDEVMDNDTVIELGIGNNLFRFRMNAFLNHLKETIDIKWRSNTVEDPYDENKSITSIHIDVSEIDHERLLDEKDVWIRDANEYLVTPEL
jgi:hypothetical protein